jgi:acetyltransferase-like isoleucine patch superfamily enzyme
LRWKASEQLSRDWDWLVVRHPGRIDPMTSSPTVRQKPKSLPGKALWVLRNRPMEFVRSLRGYALFELTRFLRATIGINAHQIKLGRNVRLQKLSTLRAERPDAQLSVGDHSIIYENAEVGVFGKGSVEIGECAVLGDIRISCRHQIRIGKRFMSSWNVFIQDYDPHPTESGARGRQVEAICASFRPRYGQVPYPETFPWDFPGEAIELGDDVWIGANSTILKGAKIGNGCIVATGAVVLRGTYPDRSVLAGNPAKVVKVLDSP